ncbi:hypothetical protein BGZ94_001057 [Podila epigama]|nr:hypothetical protein BGZ94_001057 [Podila epigama]
MKFTQTIVAVVLATLFIASSADAACICNRSYAGKHCGHSPFMSGCKTNYLYQCNGVQGSTAYEYGPCTKGCVYQGLSKDYCRYLRHSICYVEGTVTSGGADVALKVVDEHEHAFTQTIVAVVLATLFVASSADAACRCENTRAGKHCGQSVLMGGCKTDYLYQCNGVYGSTPHEYGPCKKGCVLKGLSKDYCRV